MTETANLQSDGTILDTIFGGQSKTQSFLKEIAKHKMNNALVTGGSGYLGSHVCKELKKAEWNVTILDVKNPKHEYFDNFFQKDVRNENVLNDLFSENHFDVVFHFAGRIEVGDSLLDPTEFYHVNTGGTCTLLNAMVKHGANNIIYSSTAGIYEAQENLLRESDAKNWQNNPYAGSKLAAEHAIFHSKLNHVVFRYFNLAGADPENDIGECHEPETHLIPKIYQNLNNFTIFGNDYKTLDGTCVRDYVHVSDVAAAHITAAEHLLAGKHSLTLNLGTGRGYSVQEIINLIEKVTKQKVKYSYWPRREGDPPMLIADINLAKQLLNYRPKHDIISILQTAYNWHLKQNGK